MGCVNLSLTEKRIVAVFYWDHHAVLIATQENQSVFVYTISRIGVRQQVAVNKLLHLNPYLLQACHFPKPRVMSVYKDLLFFLITIMPIMFPSPPRSESVHFSCSPPGKNNTIKVCCGNPANCALVEKGHDTTHRGVMRKGSLLWP